MATQKPKPATAMALLKMGYNTALALPVTDAQTILGALQNAERYEKVWDNEADAYKHYIGGKLPDIELSLLSEQDWVQGKLTGAKEED